MSPVLTPPSRRSLCLGLLAAGALGVAVGLPAVGLALDEPTPGNSLTLPESTAEQLPQLRCHVVVDENSVVVDGVQVVRLETVVDDHGESVRAVPDDEKRGTMIPALYDRLLEKYENEKLLADARQTLSVLTQRPELARTGELLISVDVDAPFSVVREVLYTAGQAQFGTFLFATHNPWHDATRTIESTLPRIGPPTAMDEDSETPLMLSIVVSDRGLGVMGADAVLYPDGPPDSDELVPTVPCVGGGVCTGIDDYDWVELSGILGRIKDDYPYDYGVIVVPESDVPWDIVVRVLDHARWAPHIDMDAEPGAWEAWCSARSELFPFSILAGGAS